MRNHDTNFGETSPKEKKKLTELQEEMQNRLQVARRMVRKREDIGYGRKTLNYLIPIKRILPQNPRILTRKSKKRWGTKTNWDGQTSRGELEGFIDSDAKGKSELL